MIDEVMGNPVIGDETLIENLISKGVDHAVNAVGFIESSLPRENVFNMLESLKFNILNQFNILGLSA